MTTSLHDNLTEKVKLHLLDVRLIEDDCRALLFGKRVRLLNHRVNGLQRTGIVSHVAISHRDLVVGVDVERLDGRPGPMLDTAWVGLRNLEIIG